MHQRPPISALEKDSYSGSYISGTTASTEDSSGKRCLICHKGFILLRRKITCQFCFNSFCSDHCTRKRAVAEELYFICDSCEIEETKKEINEEISKEIARVSMELKETKEINESLFREHVNKASMVNDIEMELSKQDWDHKKYEQELVSTLENEQSRGNRLRKHADELRATLEELNEKEKSMSEQCSATELQLENLKLESTQLEADKSELLTGIDKLNQMLSQSLSIDKVRKILCRHCLDVLNEALEKNEEHME